MESLDTRAAPRVKNPQTFFYFVSNLIKSELIDTGLEENLSHDTLLEFLGTTPKEIKQFKETNLLPTSWLEKISQAEKGVELLESFNLEGYLSDSPHKSKRIDLGELPKNETPQKQKTEGHINSAKRIILRENGTERLSDDAIEKYLAGLEKLKSELNTDKGIGEIIADSKSPEGGNMNAASSGMQAAGPKMTLGTVTVTTQKKPVSTINVVKKVFFSKELREKFLEDLQSFLQANKLTFDYDFKWEEQENFRETGILPPKRIDFILKKEGGSEFLASWEGNVTVIDFKPPKARKGAKEKDLIPKDEAGLAITRMLQMSKKNKTELADILGINVNTLHRMPKRETRLHRCQVEYLADWLGIPRKEFFRRIKDEILPEKPEQATPDTDPEKGTVEVEVTLETLAVNDENQQINNVTKTTELPEQDQQELDGVNNEDEEEEQEFPARQYNLATMEQIKKATSALAEGVFNGRLKEPSENGNGVIEVISENDEASGKTENEEKEVEKPKTETPANSDDDLLTLMRALVPAAHFAGKSSKKYRKAAFLGFLRGRLPGYVVYFSSKDDVNLVCFERKSDKAFFELDIDELSYK